MHIDTTGIIEFTIINHLGVIFLICPHCKKKLVDGSYYCPSCKTVVTPITQSKSNLAIKKLKRSIITLCIGALTSCCLFFITNSFTNPNSVEFVKAGLLDIYDTQTIGTAFENYFTNTSWESFETDNGELVVEFIGNFESETETSTCLIQFTLYPEEDTFEITYYELNGQPQNYEALINLLDNIYPQ